VDTRTQVSDTYRLWRTTAVYLRTAQWNEPADPALGRSKGGFGTKLHLLCDGAGLPLNAMLLAGQAHESTQFEALAKSVYIRRRNRQIRWRPRRMGTDKAYHAQHIRHWLRAQGIGTVIPPKASRTKKRRVGRPISYDRERYRGRNVIERSIGWLKECRSLATRFEKLAVHYLGMVHLALIEHYLKTLTL
jgi:transposase